MQSPLFGIRRQLQHDHLCTAKLSENPDAKMNWGVREDLQIQNIVWLHGVEILGWPKHIQFQAPSKLKPAECTAILRGFHFKTIKFHTVETHIQRRYAAMVNSTVELEVAKVGRADKGEKWPLGRPEARTKKPAKKAPKTTPLVPSEADD